MLQVRENKIPLRKWSGAQLESGRVFRVGFGLTISMFRAEFGFIFCSSRNVLRISLEEIGKSSVKCISRMTIADRRTLLSPETVEALEIVNSAIKT